MPDWCGSAVKFCTNVAGGGLNSVGAGIEALVALVDQPMLEEVLDCVPTHTYHPT